MDGNGHRASTRTIGSLTAAAGGGETTLKTHIEPRFATAVHCRVLDCANSITVTRQRTALNSST
jgi:hypothetical protein